VDRYYAANVSQTPTPIPYPGNYGYIQGAPNLPQFGPTNPGAFWFYYITESFRNVIVGGGLIPDPKNLNQITEAIEALAGFGPNFELREDYSTELRQDYSYEERE